MKLRIKTRAESDVFLRQMAQEASLSVEAIAEIAVYNILALWINEKRETNPEFAVVFDPPALNADMSRREPVDDGIGAMVWNLK